MMEVALRRRGTIHTQMIETDDHRVVAGRTEIEIGRGIEIAMTHHQEIVDEEISRASSMGMSQFQP